jgi:hypothetical protein
VAVVEKLLALKWEQEMRDARKEFNAELSNFQNEVPSIKKNSTAEVTTKSGGKYSYKYAKLDEIERTIKPLLIHRGFSYSWDSKLLDGNTIEMTCHLRHRNGHEISSSATSIIPDSIATMNAVQIPASVRTYLERGTLIQVLGLTTADDDTDGLNGDMSFVAPKELQVLKVKFKKADMSELQVKKFFEYMDVESLEEIRHADFALACNALDEAKPKGSGHEDN